jgi:hypothetical protein
MSLEPPKAVHKKDCPCAATPWVPMIFEKMVPQLWRLIFRYRRQIKHPDRQRYLMMAEERMAPDFRKKQKRIDGAKKEFPR